MTLGLLDLSIVTDRLLKQLSDAKTNSRLWLEETTAPEGTPESVDPTHTFDINFTGLPPDAAHKLAGCQVSLYLFHVAPDKAHRNTFPLGGRAHPLPEQPLALTLYYLLSAHSENSYIEEQQAMSIALKCFHDHAIMTATVPVGHRTEEFTLTMEPQSADEIGRLWLSMATPLRLSAVYRASVIFLEPEPQAKPPAGIVLKANVDAVTIEGGPLSVVSSATVGADGRATITGAGFDAASILVQIGGLLFQLTTTTPLPPGQARVVDPTTLELQLPNGMRRGRYVLRVRLDPEQPTVEVWLAVPTDVP